MRFDPSYDADRLIREETAAADHLATFLTPEAEPTLVSEKQEPTQGPFEAERMKND